MKFMKYKFTYTTLYPLYTIYSLQVECQLMIINYFLATITVMTDNCSGTRLEIDRYGVIEIKDETIVEWRIMTQYQNNMNC